MNRRGFLGALGLGATASALRPETARAAGPADSTRARPWVLRAAQAPIMKQRIYDARTGDDVSKRVLVRCDARLERSRLTGRPVRITLLRLDTQGRPFLVGNKAATEPAWVQIIVA